MRNLITTQNLAKHYGHFQCVQELNLEVPQGSVYGFLGPNGAGKSTTMKMLLGLVRPTSGAISLFGETTNNRNRMAMLRRIGSLIESPSYYGHLTGLENLRIICTLKGVPDKDIQRVLTIVRLDKQKDKKVNEYSMGMKQRLGLAGALLGTPKLLILDEPTNGLDPAGMQEMRELIRSLPQQYEMTVMVSSHLLGEIDQMADQVGIINHGQLVFQGSLSSLHQRSSHRIAIRTSDNRQAAAVLQSHGLSSTAQEGFLLLPTPSDTVTAACVQSLVQHEIGVLRIEERNTNLEDIFLALTGKGDAL
ncbi:MAG: lantibiotic transport system ATP-binding protein [Chloroflexota bacterium]|nr:lantibiotic transport system ATP-binding protein [Chloroflexota bacterium]